MLMSPFRRVGGPLHSLEKFALVASLLMGETTAVALCTNFALVASLLHAGVTTAVALLRTSLSTETAKPRVRAPLGETPRPSGYLFQRRSAHRRSFVRTYGSCSTWGNPKTALHSPHCLPRPHCTHRAASLSRCFCRIVG